MKFYILFGTNINGLLPLHATTTAYEILKQTPEFHKNNKLHIGLHQGTTYFL